MREWGGICMDDEYARHRIRLRGVSEEYRKRLDGGKEEHNLTSVGDGSKPDCIMFRDVVETGWIFCLQ